MKVICLSPRYFCLNIQLFLIIFNLQQNVKGNIFSVDHPVPFILAVDKHNIWTVFNNTINRSAEFIWIWPFCLQMPSFYFKIQLKLDPNVCKLEYLHYNLSWNLSAIERVLTKRIFKKWLSHKCHVVMNWLILLIKWLIYYCLLSRSWILLEWVLHRSAEGCLSSHILSDSWTHLSLCLLSWNDAEWRYWPDVSTILLKFSAFGTWNQVGLFITSSSWSSSLSLSLLINFQIT